MVASLKDDLTQVMQGDPLRHEGSLTQGRNPNGQRKPVECGDLPFVISRDGTWLYRGSPIIRQELVCLFASVLKRDADGQYLLETPAERGRITVEDAPFLAVELDWSRAGRDQVLTFRTNVDEVVTAGPEHPLRMAHDFLTGEMTPYIFIRAGDGDYGIEARVSRAVYYQMVALAVPGRLNDRQWLGVWSAGRFFPLSELSKDLDDHASSIRRLTLREQPDQSGVIASGVERFYEASRTVRATFDRLIESGLRDNDEISELNRRIASAMVRPDV